jgi:hypothetical protein
MPGPRPRPVYRSRAAHAGAAFWDQFFRQRRESGDDLDGAGPWTAPFLVSLGAAGVGTILEPGCGPATTRPGWPVRAIRFA